MTEFYVRVKPRSRESRVVGLKDGVVEVRVKAPPVEGRANEEVILLLSKLFGVPRGCFKILSGAKTKLKRIGVSCLEKADVDRFFGG